MAFDWNEYLNICKTPLTAYISEESIQRIIISRSYYAAYHACLKYAENNNYTKTKNSGVHKSLIKFYRDIKWNKLSIKLNRIKTLRVSADYEAIFDGLCSSTAIEAIEIAEWIIHEIRSKNP